MSKKSPCLRVDNFCAISSVHWIVLCLFKAFILAEKRVGFAYWSGRGFGVYIGVLVRS